MFMRKERPRQQEESVRVLGVASVLGMWGKDLQEERS